MADENTTDNKPIAPTGKWICKSCNEEGEADEGSCKKCGFCLWCCDSWDCAKCKKQFCGDLTLRCDVCAYCKECCKCWKCEGCGKQQHSQLPKCKGCGLCTNGCCHCFHCNNCGKTYLNFTGNGCRECRYCNACCQCIGIDRYSPESIVFHKAKPIKEFRRNPSSRFISMEIEVANVKDYKKEDIYNVVKKWDGAIVDDGSLPTTGFEINTAPAQGDKFCQQIEEICKALEAQTSIITSQCGLHVHVDARDYTYYDLRRLLILYRHIEHGLFEVVAPERKTSRFCHPCAENYAKSLDKKTQSADNNKKQILRNVYQIEPDNLERRFMQSVRGQKYNGARYSALNIHSWFYRGTIENRIHQGSKSPKHIMNWGILWAGILDYALKSPESKINKLPMANEAQLNNLIEIAPNNAIKDWLVARAVTFKKKTNPQPNDYPTAGPALTYNGGIAVANTFPTTRQNIPTNRDRAVPPMENQNALDHDLDLVEAPAVVAPPNR